MHLSLAACWARMGDFFADRRGAENHMGGRNILLDMSRVIQGQDSLVVRFVGGALIGSEFFTFVWFYSSFNPPF